MSEREQAGDQKDPRASPGDSDLTRVPVTLEVFGANPVPATAVVRQLSIASRLGRAGVGLGIAWLLAFPAIFLPVLHFVLVPGFVIGGVVLAAVRLREDRTLARVEGTCPRCRAGLDVTPGGRFRLPRSVQCPQCKNTLTLAAAATHGSETPPA
jgi:hypothetical protein